MRQFIRRRKKIIHRKDAKNAKKNPVQFGLSLRSLRLCGEIRYQHSLLSSIAIGDVFPVAQHPHPQAMPAALPKASRPSRKDSQAMKMEPMASAPPNPVSS
jgi:hypothetical protein